MFRLPLMNWLQTSGLEAVADAVLLRRYLAGDRAALELLVRRHADAVWTACQRVTRHQADAEDAFQATFLALAQRAASVRRPSYLAGWLYRVAVHAALKARRRTVRMQGIPASEIASPVPSPPDHDLAPALLEEVGRLAERYRLAVVLCDLEGRTQAEAARLLGWKLGTLSGRLSRARRLLRGRLTRRGLTLGAAGAGFVLQTTVEAASTALIRTALNTITSTTPAAGVLTLTKGALAAMSLSKFKWATAITALVAVFLSAGAGTCWLLAGQGPLQEPPASKSPVTAPVPQPPRITLEDGVPTAFPEPNPTSLADLEKLCPLIFRKIKPPIMPESNSPLRQLCQARLEVTLENVTLRWEAYRTGRATIGEVFDASHHLKQAVDELYSLADSRRPWYRERVVLARYLENVALEQFRAGTTTRLELTTARRGRLSAEIDLLRLGEGKPSR